MATKSVLSEYRTTEYWNKIYDYATQIAHLHSIDIQSTPLRKRRRPAHLADSVILESVGSRENESTSECLKIQFYLPVLDKFIIELNHRFDNKNLLIMKGIAACSPSSSTFLSYEDLKPFAERYDLVTQSLQVELSLVSTAIANKPDIKSLVAFRNYLYSSQSAYKSIFQMAQIALTIAVTSAECERSFSSLKRIKTRLRTRMVEERLSDLAILAIEKEIAETLNYEEIIDQFAASDKNRRILL